MPFIPNQERPILNSNPTRACKPGHLAYLTYQEMKRRWRAAPSWTTADKIHEQFVMAPDDNEFLEALYSQMPMVGFPQLMNAASLSWQVFFNLVVMPYEIQKRKENGDVE